MLLQRITTPILRIINRQISALYITGDKAKENYSILTPYFDFQSRLTENNTELSNNIALRKLPNNIDELYLLWDVYRNVQLKKKELENRRVEISSALKKIASDNNEDMIRKYKYEGTMVREDLKVLKEKSYHMEDTFVHKYLALPNILHLRTPTNGIPKIIFEEPIPAENLQTKSHLSYTNLIEYYDPNCYFLLEAAAELDLLISFYGVDRFKELGYVQFSNPDFCKSILAEGAGIQLDRMVTVKEDDTEASTINRLHLPGAGSMLSYLGFITKLSVFKSALPMKFVSSGREYRNALANNENIGLYGVNQSSQVQLFQALATKEEADTSFDETVKHISDVLKQFNMHFRCVYVPADRLQTSESLRVDFEMYSKHLQRYICIGNLSSYGDYISKRLLFYYKSDGGSRDPHFPHLIAGTIVNVPKLLAIMLENKESLEVPTFLRYT